MRHLRRIERMDSARTKRRTVLRSYRFPWDDWQARLKAKLAMSYYEGNPLIKCATCAAYTHSPTPEPGWRCSGCLDTDHAVAVEREAICEWHEREADRHTTEALEDDAACLHETAKERRAIRDAHLDAAHFIRAGEHHREGK